MPLPYLTERPDEVSANWRIGTPAECQYGCHLLISEIAASAWPIYDMVDIETPPSDDEVRRPTTKQQSSATERREDGSHGVQGAMEANREHGSDAGSPADAKDTGENVAA
jgi:hypothetical protein